MPEMSRYAHGVPSWVDMGTHDLKATLDFYAGLFGWDYQDMGEETGHYTMASIGGKQVAGLGPAQDPGPSRWTTYVDVDDAEAVAKAAEAAGGTVVVPPMQVMTAGKMAVFRDTTGAFISAWQPGDHIGAQLVNEVGSFIWCELATSDLDKAKAFYSDVFGWGWGGSDEYAEAKVDGRSIAGALSRPADIPAEVPDSWLVYFGSADVDSDAKKAAGLGAVVRVPPRDIPNTGRFSVLTDPQGAAFAIFKV